jgi:hypothetical protein
VKAVRDLVRFRKARAAGTIDSITNLEDVSRINYSEDRLPPYDELRTELIRVETRRDLRKEWKPELTTLIPKL